MKGDICILDENKICNDCSECEKCDLDPKKYVTTVENA